MIYRPQKLDADTQTDRHTDKAAYRVALQIFLDATKKSHLPSPALYNAHDSFLTMPIMKMTSL